jgi:hypothetical protein
MILAAGPPIYLPYTWDIPACRRQRRRARSAARPAWRRPRPNMPSSHQVTQFSGPTGRAQATEELPRRLRQGRDAVLGGWSFSDGTHRWPVSDCTAEALSAALMVHRRADLHPCTGSRLPDARLYQAVEFILSRQNPDHGFGTYERTRGPAFLEKLNATEMYAGCMTDFSHPEPTASCVAALARFRRGYSGYQRRRIDHAIRRGIRYLRSCQRPDGSYQGSWGINFTYAACFVTEALLTAGVPVSDPSMSRAVSWLRQHQKPDGGWGEHYTSCLTGRYAEHPDSQAAMTAWALLVLLRTVGPGDPGAPCTAWRTCSSTAPAADGPARRQAASSSRPPSWTTACTKTSFPPGPSRPPPHNPTDLIPLTQPPIRPRPLAARITQIRAIIGYGATTKAAVPKVDIDSSSAR